MHETRNVVIFSHLFSLDSELVYVLTRAYNVDGDIHWTTSKKQQEIKRGKEIT